MRRVGIELLLNDQSDSGNTCSLEDMLPRIRSHSGHETESNDPFRRAERRVDFAEA